VRLCPEKWALLEEKRSVEKVLLYNEKYIESEILGEFTEL
jgi:hypothetical protein